MPAVTYLQTSLNTTNLQKHYGRIPTELDGVKIGKGEQRDGDEYTAKG